MSIGFTKEEILEKINSLNNTKYEKLYNEKRAILIKQYGDMTPNYIEQFFLWYTQEMLPQFTADLIEANNLKLETNIKQLLLK